MAEIFTPTNNRCTNTALGALPREGITGQGSKGCMDTVTSHLTEGTVGRDCFRMSGDSRD